MENEILSLKTQIEEQQKQIQEFISHINKKEDSFSRISKQNEKIEQAQEKILRQLEMFDELTTDKQGKKIQYSVKANLKGEIMQNLIEELCFQQSISKLEQKIQDINFSLGQRISQIHTSLVNVEAFCHSNLSKVKETFEIIQDMDKNKNFSKSFKEKYDQLVSYIQKIELSQNNVSAKCDQVEASVLRKVDINDIGKLAESNKDGFVSKQAFQIKLEQLQQQLYNEIRQKMDQSQFETNFKKLDQKFETIKLSVKNIAKMPPPPVVKVVQNSKSQKEEQEVNKPTKEELEEIIKQQESLRDISMVNNLNPEFKAELDKKIDELNIKMNKQQEEFNTMITDYQGQIVNVKNNFEGKIKHLQSLISQGQTSAGDAVKRSREIETYVLNNMLTKEYIQTFQVNVNEKINTFDKGYTETIDKLSSISNRANDSLGDLAIRLKLIPTREELIQRLEFVQGVSTDNQTIKQDISKMLALIKQHDEFFLLKANKIDFQIIMEELEAIKKREPDFIVMQCEKDVTLMKDEVKECQKEIVDFRAEIIKMLKFSIFNEGELERYQEVQKKKGYYNNHETVNKSSTTFGQSLQQTQRQLNTSPFRSQVQGKVNKSNLFTASPAKPVENYSHSQSKRDSQIEIDQDEEDETGRNIFPWVEQIRKGIFDTYKVYDVLYTKANHSQVQELFDKKANKMIVGKLMDIINNMKKQLVYLVVGQNQLIRSIRNPNEQGGQSQSQKEENRHRKEIELQSLLRQNTKLLVWISSQDLEQDQQFVKKLKEKNAITVDFNMMEQMVDEVFQRYQQLNKLYLKQPNVKYTQEEIKLLDNFVRDILPNRQLSFNDTQNDNLQIIEKELEDVDFITETMQSQLIKSNKRLLEKQSTVIDLKQPEDLQVEEELGKTEPIQSREKQLNKQVSIVTDKSGFIKLQPSDDTSTINKNNKSRVRIDLSDKKDKLNKSHISYSTSNQQGEVGNLFLNSIQKDTQLLKDSLNTLITKDGYTKIIISPEEAEQIKKESKCLKSNSTFISKKASTVSTARTMKKSYLNNQFATNESQESIQYFDMLASQNSKAHEQKLYNSNIIVQNVKTRDSYKKSKSKLQQQGQFKLNLSNHMNRGFGMNESNSDLNQTYSDSFTQQPTDLSTTNSRKQRNQLSLSLNSKKQMLSKSENNTPREDVFLNKSQKRQQIQPNETSYDVTDY